MKERYVRLFTEDMANIMATTIEFYVSGGKLFVEYNKEKMRFVDFVKKIPNAKNLLKVIYSELLKQFPKVFKIMNINDEIEHKKSNWENLLIDFILQYFSLYRDPFDVVIKGRKVAFNLEKNPMGR